jgi:hypothetical protein
MRGSRTSDHVCAGRRDIISTAQGSPFRRCTQGRAQADWGDCQYVMGCATIPHIQHRRLPVLIQCLLYHIQRRACLLLHALNAIRHIFCAQERVYAVMYPRALLRKRPRGVGDEGLFRSKRCAVHCKSCARLDMSSGSLRLRKAKWRRCGHGSRHDIDAGVRSDRRRRVEVHV